MKRHARSNDRNHEKCYRAKGYSDSPSQGLRVSGAHPSYTRTNLVRVSLTAAQLFYVLEDYGDHRIGIL